MAENLAESDPLRPHAHVDNPDPPDADPTLYFVDLAGRETAVSLTSLLRDYPQAMIPAYTYTTDHGQHGPYRLAGVSLRAFLDHHGAWSAAWQSVAVISADGFGNRVLRQELVAESGDPLLLCTHIDGERLARRRGLVRLVAPSETENALRQVKWVRRIELR